MDPENCVAAVTGASRGIGRWVARTLAERGYVVAANDLEAPEDTLKEIENTASTGSFTCPRVPLLAYGA